MEPDCGGGGAHGPSELGFPEGGPQTPSHGAPNPRGGSADQGEGPP